MPPLWSVLLLALLHLVKSQDNLALGKKAWQSESLPELGARRAVDGDFNADLRRQRCTQTSWGGSSDPWWLVDLGAVHRIVAVSVSNRGDDHHDRINGSIILAGNEFDGSSPNLESYSTCAEIGSLGAGETRLFTCHPPPCGRYVAVSLSGKDKILTLCEVQVFSSIGRKNLALGFPAWQSSTDHNHVAGRAVDGGKNSALLASSCMHTQEQSDPWWLVDLGGVQNISAVAITNRDSFPRRIRLAEISVGDQFDGSTFVSSSFKRCAVVDSIDEGQSKTFTCNTVLQGRYLAVHISGQAKVLTMCEIQVFSPYDENTAQSTYCTDSGPWQCPYKSPVACAAGPAEQVSLSGNIYHLFNSSRKWENASAICAQIDGHLAAVKTVEVQQGLLAEMPWSRGWIGSGFAPKSNTSTWINGSVPSVTPANTVTGKSGDWCPVLQSSGLRGFASVDCSTPLTFICQNRDPTAPTKPTDKKPAPGVELHYIVLLSIVGGVVILFIIIIPIIICVRNRQEPEEIPPLPKPLVIESDTIFIMPTAEVNGIEKEKDAT